MSSGRSSNRLRFGRQRRSRRLRRLQRPCSSGRMRDDGDRVAGVIAHERIGGPARWRDQEPRPRDDRAVLRAPCLDVDVRERRPAPRDRRRKPPDRSSGSSSCRPHRGTGSSGTRSSGRAPCIRRARRWPRAPRRCRRGNRRCCADGRSPIPKRRADSADELGPPLGGAAAKVERAHRAGLEMLLDLPEISDGNGEIVAPPGPRRVDQGARMVLGAAPVPVDDVQDAAAAAPFTARRTGVGVSCIAGRSRIHVSRRCHRCRAAQFRRPSGGRA